MADSYHIIDGKVVPYSGGRKCNDTDAWRDATPLELQLQEQLSEYEYTIAAQEAEIDALRTRLEDTVRDSTNEIEALRAEVERLRTDLMESDEIREKLGHLLTRTAAALKGEPPAGVWHSWHDLPEKAAQLAEALRELEEREQRDEALLRQALEALESADWYIGQLEWIVYSPDDTETHEERAKVQSTIAALRERLGEEGRDDLSQGDQP